MRSTVGNRPKNPIFQSERKTEPAKFSKNQSKNSKPDNNFDSDILASQISEGDEDVSEGHNYSEHSENEVHYFDRNKIESNANANQLSSGAQDMNHNFPRISHQPFKEKKLDFAADDISRDSSIGKFTGSGKLNNNKERITLKNQKINDSKACAIQIIKYDGKKRFELNKEAEEVLMNFEGNLCFVVLAGKYRTGKSFLLNKILDIQGGEGFKVDSSVDACTEGIWMWSQPIYLEKENLHIFFLDTEGTSSVDREVKHDAKIFALAMLMSSIFIFNSVGCIDEIAVSQLNLTTTLSSNIEMTVNKSKSSDVETGLAYFTPKFLWLLRDFTLEIQNSKGQKITANEYLENSLSEDKFKGDQNKKIRRSLLNYFRDRDCFTMVRPVDEEKDLKKLESLPRNRLRKEFINELKQLREKIISKCAPKQLNGINLNSRMYCNMLQNYVESINHDGVPNIASAWEYILENECIAAYNDSLQLYIDSMKQLLVQDKPKTPEEMLSILKIARENCLERFQFVAGVKEKNTFYIEFRDKLKQVIDTKETKALKLNDEMASGQFKQAIHFLTQELIGNISGNIYGEENLEGFIEDFNRFLTDFNENTLFSKKSQILTEFIKNFFPDVLKSISHSIRMKYEGKFADVGTEKTIFREKEGNFMDNIQLLEKKNNLFEEKIRKIDREKLELDSQRNTLKANLENLQHEYDDLLEKYEEQKQNISKKDQQINTMKSELEGFKAKKKEKSGGLFSCFSKKKKYK